MIKEDLIERSAGTARIGSAAARKAYCAYLI